MKIDVLTLFPEMFSSLDSSVIGRAVSNNAFELKITNFRDFSLDKHKKVDDYCFGSGEGMLIKPQPLIDAIKSVKTSKSKVIYLSPCGKVFNSDLAKELAQNEHLVLICGHYEGIDQRIIDDYVDEEISVGDYVTTCGELPAMILIDAVARFVPNVLGNQNSAHNDSFENYLLEQPQYTRPSVYDGKAVPEVLLNGNHQEIQKWQLEQRILRTKKNRPDLYEKYLASKK